MMRRNAGYRSDQVSSLFKGFLIALQRHCLAGMETNRRYCTIFYFERSSDMWEMWE